MTMIALLGLSARADAAARPLDDASPELRIGGALVALFAVGFIGWSAFARLDAAIHSPGVVRVSGDRQAVQSVSGGVVSALRVKEGDHVRAGQVLLDFATTEALAQERSLASRVVGLQAEIARIGAERLGLSKVAMPPEFAALSGDDRRAADEALAMEQAELDARHALVAAQRAVLRQRIAEVGHQVQGYRERQAANQLQGQYNQEELDSYEQLLAKGFATKSRVLALKRSAAAIDGDTGSNLAEIARLRTTGGETEMQMLQILAQRQQDNAERLRQAQTELETTLPQWHAAADQLARTRVRAPVDGTVMGLVANSVGGVAPAGGKLMEIVPTAKSLVVESRVSLADANDLHPGQRAEVRLTALPGRNMLPLDGVVSRVSPDSFTDDKTGRAFYTATVTIPPAELARAGRAAGIGAVRPGTPVDVTVPLRKRSALSYWIEPLSRRVGHIFIERLSGDATLKIQFLLQCTLSAS